MSAPPLKKKVLNCINKARWNDEVTARAAASIFCEEYNLKALRVYRCPECSGWHCTSQLNSAGREGRKHLATKDNPFSIGIPTEP